jgi:hypothetical protein
MLYPVSLVFQKPFQRSAMVLSAIWGIAFHYQKNMEEEMWLKLRLNCHRSISFEQLRKTTRKDSR